VRQLDGAAGAVHPRDSRRLSLRRTPRRGRWTESSHDCSAPDATCLAADHDGDRVDRAQLGRRCTGMGPYQCIGLNWPFPHRPLRGAADSCPASPAGEPRPRHAHRGSPARLTTKARHEYLACEIAAWRLAVGRSRHPRYLPRTELETCAFCDRTGYPATDMGPARARSGQAPGQETG